MAYPKRLNAANKTNQDRAIESHAGFITFVSGRVKAAGIQNVLMAEKGDELYWLKKAWDRLLNFAEEVQLKSIPTQLAGSGEDGQFVVEVKISDEDNTSQEPRNRISQYVEI